MKYIFLINSFTIKEKTNTLEKKITTYCQQNDIDYIIEVNSKDYSTEDILKKYQKEQNVILAVGGDGIINRVLNHIINTQNILGIIPFGTGNDFYKSIKREFNNKYTKCDIAKINNKYFLNTACFGIDAEVANNKNILKTKWIPQKQKYNIGLIYSFFKYKCRNLELNINKEKIIDNFTTIAVCNGSFYGNGYQIAPLSNLQDGLLDVYIAPKLNKINMLRLILKMKKGKHESDKKIQKFKTNQLTIKSKQKIKCNIDGECLEDKIFKVKLIKDAITIYYDQELIEYLTK